MELKLKSFSTSDYFEAIFVTIILSLIGIPLFFQSIRLILIEKFSFFFLVGIILGIIIFFVLFMSIKTISKNIIFYDDFFEVQFLGKTVNYNYPETEWIKFIKPSKGSERIVIRIKKRKYGVIYSNKFEK